MVQDYTQLQDKAAATVSSALSTVVTPSQVVAAESHYDDNDDDAAKAAFLLRVQVPLEFAEALGQLVLVCCLQAFF